MLHLKKFPKVENLVISLPYKLTLVYPPSVDEPILSFQRNAFLTLKDERNLLKKQDPSDPKSYRMAINLLYHEVGM